MSTKKPTMEYQFWHEKDCPSYCDNQGKEDDCNCLYSCAIEALKSQHAQHESEVEEIRHGIESKGHGLHFAGLLKEEKGVKESLISFDFIRAQQSERRAKQEESK